MPITVTKPSMPPLVEFIPYLEDIWERKIVTNSGLYHQEFEAELCKHLKIKHLSIFTNGTVPLTTALQTMKITGEVITTPYSFAATTHSIQWVGTTPVFADVDNYGNISPEKIEEAITPKTTAIMPVHCYGNPCKVNEIQEIADRYGLKVIYDAAHCFGVEINGKSILEYGDMATLSFHATKSFNTLEGGALVCRDNITKTRIDNLKNFGFVSETKVIINGINGKMDEVRAAYGLLLLKHIGKEIEKRKKITEHYRNLLSDVKGLRFFNDIENVKHNYIYFPIFIDEKEYGMSRDALYERLKENDFYARRYFYPLISEFLPYKGLPSSAAKNLPNATKMSREVICLPMYADLVMEDVEKICEVVKGKRWH
ncbi:MAG: DegT/DnrJ/EryC1/StrS family aminotransferase [Chitinivibrionia bacterium]|nr:DegT/DnrJ/EryC1/StrS family aminotransferase [Chitinivibrionia bacterium]